MSEQRLAIKLPSIICSQEFVPTGLMVLVICAYLEAGQQGKVVTPRDILIQNGHSPANWYNWQKVPHFADWWLHAQAEWHTRIGLAQVHRAMYINATGNSAMDRKLFLERFDADYKPQTRQEHGFDLGAMPPEEKERSVAASRARAAKFVESRERTTSPDEDTAQTESDPSEANLRESVEGQEDGEADISRFCCVGHEAGAEIQTKAGAENDGIEGERAGNQINSEPSLESVGSDGEAAGRERNDVGGQVDTQPEAGGRDERA